MMKKDMINLEAIRLETREEIGTDAAYFAGDYHGCSAYIDDAIMERADNETSIYYSDIIKYISEHVEAVNDAINEFGWDGCGGDLYKAGQMAEFMEIENGYFSQLDGIAKYAALMDLIYTNGRQEITAETWEAITEELENTNICRFSDITDIVNEALEAEEEAPESVTA